MTTRNDEVEYIMVDQARTARKSVIETIHHLYNWDKAENKSSNIIENTTPVKPRRTGRQSHAVDLQSLLDADKTRLPKLSRPSATTTSSMTSQRAVQFSSVRDSGISMGVDNDAFVSQILDGDDNSTDDTAL